MIGYRRIANRPRFTHIGDHPKNGEIQMTKMKTLSAVIFLSATVATPVFAQSTYHGRAHGLRNFYGANNQLNGPLYATPRTLDGWNMETFGFIGRDPSRVGGEDPDLRPSGS
jgi:hypothetical protein